MKRMKDIERTQRIGSCGMMVRLRRAGLRFFRRESGVTLVETLAGMAVLGMIGVGFMSALGSTFQATEINDEKVVAENLIRTQLEFFAQPTLLRTG